MATNPSQKRNIRILFVENDLNFQRALVEMLSPHFSEIEAVNSIEEARTLIKKKNFDCVLLDKYLEDGVSFPLIREIREICDRSSVIMVSTSDELSCMFQALDLGASDYIVKPPGNLQFSDDFLTRNFVNEMVWKILKCERNISQTKYNSIVNAQISKGVIPQLVGRSLAMAFLRSQITSSTDTVAHTLISGELGSGKSHVAELLNAKSERPFVILDLLSVPTEHVELELFGYVEGAFPGAICDKIGILNQVSGGDLIIYSICDLPYKLQGRLARVLEEKSYSPVGSAVKFPTVFRLISTSTKNIHSLVQGNEFNLSLFSALSKFIRIEPLRERKEDIEDLARSFLMKIAGVRYSLSEDAVDYLKSLSLPGNARELRVLIETAYVKARKADRSLILRGDFSESEYRIFPTAKKEISLEGFKSAVSWAEQTYIQKALALYDMDAEQAYSAMGMGRTTFYSKLKEQKVLTPAKIRKAKNVPARLKSSL